MTSYGIFADDWVGGDAILRKEFDGIDIGGGWSGVGYRSSKIRPMPLGVEREKACRPGPGVRVFGPRPPGPLVDPKVDPTAAVREPNHSKTPPSHGRMGTWSYSET